MTEHNAFEVMHLRVLLPADVLVDENVVKIVAEAENGAFCLLPRHIDFVAALVPGILSLVDQQGNERFVGVNEGVLVKCGQEVWVSVLDGVCGDELDRLHTLVKERYSALDEYERKARTALARLEAATLRGVRELQDLMHD